MCTVLGCNCVLKDEWTRNAILCKQWIYGHGFDTGHCQNIILYRKNVPVKFRAEGMEKVKARPIKKDGTIIVYVSNMLA